jgi:hypothetical protein
MLLTFPFDRNSIVAYKTNQMLDQVIRPQHGYTGWAFYPKGFFGNWQPANRHAWRSMKRPKRVVFDSVAGGWVFEIESRMLATRNELRPVGGVYRLPDLQSTVPAQYLRDTIGYLATTKTKRVRVVCSA